MRKMLTALAMALALQSAFGVEFRSERGIGYTEGRSDGYSAERCTLEVYHPEQQPAEGLPVVVWFHGGSLTGGEPSVPEELKGGDYVVVAPGYRLIPKVGVEGCIDDAASAVAWTLRHIGNYGGDARKVFVSGHSAGGYLTSMIGLDKHWLERYGVDADSIAGLIPLSGQAITHFAHRKQQGLGELTPTVDSLAPMYHVRADAPPYVIITGDRDQELYGRYEENALLWRLLKLVGHPDVSIYELDGHDHGAMVHPAFHILKAHVGEILKRRN